MLLKELPAVARTGPRAAPEASAMPAERARLAEDSER